MDTASWLALTTWVAIAISSPLAWESSRRPRRSGARLILAGSALAVFTVAVAATLRYARVPTGWVLGSLIAGVGVALVTVIVGTRRGLRARRAERNPNVAPDQLVTEPPRLWVRPLAPRGPGGHGPLRRVDEWLAADGPRPTAGWWHNGGLLLDQRGAALVDAAGLRHALPAGVTVMLNLSVPRSLMLLNDAHAVLVRLPITGFSTPALKDFAAATNWQYSTELAEFIRGAPDEVDLRRSVVDHAAKDDGAVRRVSGSLRRHFHRS
ncbi:MAG TPA: hypothetical protein VHX38_12810 [Pseudonocardiaceae bacterium]|jgi:hypothetical protein|nr:hypothetical protein [Pseudonocardiaceae bacterium]